MKKKIIRWTVYLSGILILSFGITLNAKTTLGVAPINSMAYTCTILTGVKLAYTMFAMQCLFFAATVLVKGKTLRAMDFLQIPASVIMSSFVGVFDEAITIVPGNLGVKAVMLVIACAASGLGVMLIATMRIAPSPPDGFIQAVSDKSGKSMGLVKNFVDCGSVLISLVIGLVFGGRIIGIGVGTLFSMIAVGRVVWLCEKLFKDRLVRAAAVPLPVAAGENR